MIMKQPPFSLSFSFWVPITIWPLQSSPFQSSPFNQLSAQRNVWGGSAEEFWFCRRRCRFHTCSPLLPGLERQQRNFFVLLILIFNCRTEYRVFDITIYLFFWKIKFLASTGMISISILNKSCFTILLMSPWLNSVDKIFCYLLLLFF